MREAEVGVTDAALDAMGIGDLLSLGREAGLLAVEELDCRGNGAVVALDVETTVDEKRLDSLDCVDRWNHVAGDGAHRYVVAFTAPELPPDLEETADDLVGSCDPEIEEDGATMSLVGPHDAVTGQLREYEAAGVPAELRRIGGYDGPDHPLAELTDRQREVVETAWEMGYYEVPKEATADEVAAELGLDPSTVTEHLQRAERNLLGRLL